MGVDKSTDFPVFLDKSNDYPVFLAIAWQYPGQALEVIPASYSRMTRPDLSLPRL
jgi:hypothetical protein